MKYIDKLRLQSINHDLSRYYEISEKDIQVARIDQSRIKRNNYITVNFRTTYASLSVLPTIKVLHESGSLGDFGYMAICQNTLGKYSERGSMANVKFMQNRTYLMTKENTPTPSPVIIELVNAMRPQLQNKKKNSGFDVI